jgi:hypothetical protein
MDDKNLKLGIMDFFQEHDFKVSEIPVQQGKKTPDLLVEKDEVVFVIEIKEKDDDSARIVRENEGLAKGLIVSRSESINRTNSVSGIVSNAVEQLAKYQAPPKSLKLVWLHASGCDPELKMMQFHGSIYGIVDIIDMDSGKSRKCYYFGFNDFFRYSEILDGAILTAGSSLQVCVNDLSPRASELRKSPLVTMFSRGVLDPAELEKQGVAYIADCDLDRRDTTQLLTYLQNKYQKRWLMDLNFTQHTAALAVNKVS